MSWTSACQSWRPDFHLKEALGLESGADPGFGEPARRMWASCLCQGWTDLNLVLAPVIANQFPSLLFLTFIFVSLGIQLCSYIIHIYECLKFLRINTMIEMLKSHNIMLQTPVAIWRVRDRISDTGQLHSLLQTWDATRRVH